VIIAKENQTTKKSQDKLAYKEIYTKENKSHHFSINTNTIGIHT